MGELGNAAAIGRRIGLNILQQSPLDAREESGKVASAPVRLSWSPSRFNVRATTDDGRLVLWNTLSNALSIFKAEQAPHVLALLKSAAGKEYQAEESGLPGYMVERGYLVKRGTDEYRKFLHHFGHQHYRTDRLELFLLSSEDCNFRCTYCYEKFAEGTMRPEIRRGVHKLVSDRIKSLSVLNINWFGGEPLYGWPAIEELAPAMHQMCLDNDVLYASNMTTNGYLLTPDVVDKLLAWRCSYFQITLDGLPQDHDCSRPTRTGEGTFDTIFENLKSMARRPDTFRVSLRVNFSHHNAPRLPEFIELMQSQFKGDSRFHLDFHPVHPLGSENDKNLSMCSDSESHELVMQMKGLASRLGLSVSNLKDINFPGGQVCYAARPYNLIIGATGKVMKCTVVLDTEEHNIVGQLGEDGRFKLNQDNMALWTEPAFERDDQCQRCVVLPSCQGISCPLPRITSDVRPCVSTRTHAKDELRSLIQDSAPAPAKTREVLEPRPVVQAAG
jgi:uncharacterized protein